jgi:hypothetical protein
MIVNGVAILNNDRFLEKCAPARREQRPKRQRAVPAPPAAPSAPLFADARGARTQAPLP